MADRQRFEELWRRTVGVDTEAAWLALDRGYGDPARSYHNWRHIEALLAQMDAVRDVAEFSEVDFDAVELAIWFHDVIYDPRASDNEARSAKLFEAFADAPALSSRVSAMILATAGHDASGDASTRLLLDLDLGILGASSDDYRRYADAVRREYAHVAADVWRAGRPAVLRRFLERGRIYQTSLFFDRMETAARRNIANEIAGLEA